MPNAADATLMDLSANTGRWAAFALIAMHGKDPCSPQLSCSENCQRDELSGLTAMGWWSSRDGCQPDKHGIYIEHIRCPGQVDAWPLRAVR